MCFENKFFYGSSGPLKSVSIKNVTLKFDKKSLFLWHVNIHYLGLVEKKDESVLKYIFYFGSSGLFDAKSVWIRNVTLNGARIFISEETLTDYHERPTHFLGSWRKDRWKCFEI